MNKNEENEKVYVKMNDKIFRQYFKRMFRERIGVLGYIGAKDEVIEFLRDPLLPLKLRTIILEVIEKDFAVIWKFLESEKESGDNE